MIATTANVINATIIFLPFKLFTVILFDAAKVVIFRCVRKQTARKVLFGFYFLTYINHRVFIYAKNNRLLSSFTIKNSTFVLSYGYEKNYKQYTEDRLVDPAGWGHSVLDVP